MTASRIPKIGEIIIYKEAISEGMTVSQEWPGIIYKTQVADHNPMIVGASVFIHGTPMRLAYLNYSKEAKPQTWRFQDDEL